MGLNRAGVRGALAAWVGFTLPSALLMGMARNLCPDRARATIAILAAVAILLWTTALGQVLTIAVAGAIGWRFLSRDISLTARPNALPIGRRVAVACWVARGVLLAGLPIVSEAVGGKPLGLTDGFFRTGSLVFGGGHTV
jgi:chromate transporter